MPRELLRGRLNNPGVGLDVRESGDGINIGDVSHDRGGNGELLRLVKGVGGLRMLVLMELGGEELEENAR